MSTENPYERTMRQAAMTAEYWMECACRFVNSAFPLMTTAERTPLIAAYMRAAASDQSDMLRIVAQDAQQQSTPDTDD